MGWTVQTLGNAMAQFCLDDVPILVTDPWLRGEAYFGSWALERPLIDAELTRATASRFVWFSHGHPDHFHFPSLALLSKEQVMLLPEQYDNELERTLQEMGFTTRVLPDKQWVTLADGLRVLCVGNENMDAIIAVDAGGVLVLNKNDSPFCGEDAFFRRLVRGFPRSYMLALCAYDADMINTFDQDMKPQLGDPDERKPGVIWSVARTCEYLGIQTFCCSSSQHIYVRPDSVWANEYRVTWADVQRLWTSQGVAIVGPFSRIDLATGAVSATPGETPPIGARAAATNGEDDWEARLSAAEWAEVERFALQFHTLRRYQDFTAFTVGGETRYYYLRPAAKGGDIRSQTGVNFIVPRHSLLETVRSGYFDDLLIGNLMKTQLFNMALYPRFSPLVAKLGGNAKVFTVAQLWRFRMHYFRCSPVAFLRFRGQHLVDYMLTPAARRVAQALGVFGVLKAAKSMLVGGPRKA